LTEKRKEAQRRKKKIRIGVAWSPEGMNLGTLAVVGRVAIESAKLVSERNLAVIEMFDRFEQGAGRWQSA